MTERDLGPSPSSAHPLELFSHVNSQLDSFVASLFPHCSLSFPLTSSSSCCHL